MFRRQFIYQTGFMEPIRLYGNRRRRVARPRGRVDRAHTRAASIHLTERAGARERGSERAG
jgi:hypothetical protein